MLRPQTAPPRVCFVLNFLAAGVGWGLIHAVILVGTALSKHTGPGAAFSLSCPHIPSVIVSGESVRRVGQAVTVQVRQSSCTPIFL